MLELDRDIESFIPFRRRALIEVCLEEEKLTGDDAASFRRFCELLTTCLHLDMEKEEQVVDEHYSLFDPDRDTIPLNRPEDVSFHREELCECFRRLAIRANYFEVTEEMLEKCFDDETLFELRTKVNFDEYDQVLCFARGDTQGVHEQRRWWRMWKCMTREIDVYQRVLLLLVYRESDDEGEEVKKRRPKGRLSQAKPGKVYVYFYKDVPKCDLELLFPNVEVGMTVRDKLMLGVPALGGMAAVVIKVLPQIIIVVGVILLLTLGPEAAEKMGLAVSKETVNRIWPVLTAVLGLVIAFGGLAIKQWTAYSKKRIKFLKEVTEQLFFRNLASNRAVFHRIIASAREEEGKEMMLVLYHLWTSEGDDRLSPAELDAHIEEWMERNLDALIDFDIDSPVRQLCALRAGRSGRQRSLLEIEEDGTLRAMALAEAVAHLEELVIERATGFEGVKVERSR